MGRLKSSFIVPHGVGTRFNVCWHMLKHVRTNDIIIKLHLHQFFVPISFSLFIVQYVYTIKIGHLVLVEKFKGLSRMNYFHIVKKIITKVYNSSIILGGANSLCYGEYSKVGFHFSKAPWVNATNQNHHFNK
jgi:hypothetical protein